MKQLRTSKAITLIASLLFLFFSNNCFATDLLDSVKSNAKIVKELKDAYRVFEIYHKITQQNEFLAISLDGDEEKEFTDSLFTSFVNECNELQKLKISDDSLNYYSQKFLKAAIRNYTIGKTKGVESEVFKEDMKKFGIVKHVFLNYVASACPTSHYVSMTEDMYWKTMDKKNYIKSPAYSRYEKMGKEDLKSKLILLDSITRSTNDFQEFAIYRIEFADQNVKHHDLLEKRGDTTLLPEEKAVQIYKSVLDCQKYCIYLFESWLKWRTVYQQNNGLSKSSDIPNDMFDSVREKEAAFVLKAVAENEKDEMCINQFLLFATHDIVRRFGDYPYGNQNTVEYHEIFDDHK